MMTKTVSFPFQIWQPITPNFWGYDDTEYRSALPRRKVYEGQVELDDVTSNHLKSLHDALEKLFRIFNLEHPADFQGHSLSVNDVVVLGETAFMCNPLGWSEIGCESLVEGGEG
jgi:hypothetical protein